MIKLAQISEVAQKSAVLVQAASQQHSAPLPTWHFWCKTLNRGIHAHSEHDVVFQTVLVQRRELRQRGSAQHNQLRQGKAKASSKI